MKQHLMQEEKKLLECLRENYNCKYLYFDAEIEQWVFISENENEMFVRAMFNECTFTLSRYCVHSIEELLGGENNE